MPMFPWHERRLDQAAKNKLPAPPGNPGRSPYQPNETEKKYLDKSSGQGRRAIHRAIRARTQSECAEPGCSNEATQFDGGDRGTCEEHTPTDQLMEANVSLSESDTQATPGLGQILLNILILGLIIGLLLYFGGKDEQRNRSTQGLGNWSHLLFSGMPRSSTEGIYRH